MFGIMFTVTFFIGIVLLLRTVFKKRISARLQYGLWFLVVVKLLVFPMPDAEGDFSVLGLVAQDRQERQERLSGEGISAEEFAAEQAGGTAQEKETVNESLWEHVKLVFWPFLGAALVLNRDRPGGTRPWLLVLPLLCALTLALGWVYNVMLGGEAMWVDIAIYVLVMVLGFWLPTRFSGPFRGARWLLPILAAALLALLIAWFTVRPPEALLFRDLSAVGSWLPLPC